MTKKDYDSVAGAINWRAFVAREEAACEPTDASRCLGLLEELWEVANELADRFELFANFDRDRFMDACDVTDPPSLTSAS